MKTELECALTSRLHEYYKCSYVVETCSHPQQQRTHRLRLQKDRPDGLYFTALHS